jgi:hypothetical protein
MYTCQNTSKWNFNGVKYGNCVTVYLPQFCDSGRDFSQFSHRNTERSLLSLVKVKVRVRVRVRVRVMLMLRLG